MAVNVAKLFRDAKFSGLHDKAKILYIYLATNPDLNTVGVFSPNIPVVQIETGLNEDELRQHTKKLIKLGKIYAKEFDGVVYFIVPDHFNTISKSEASVNRVNKTLKALPQGLVDFLDSIGINTSSKIRTFVKPTPEEVSQYALSLGYLINGKDFVDYYDGQAERYGKKHWVDTRGKQVSDWKGKLRKVWFKEDRKLQEVKGAPKGYEHFYIIKDGNIIQPESWRDGKPHHKLISYDIALKKEFEK